MALMQNVAWNHVTSDKVKVIIYFENVPVRFYKAFSCQPVTRLLSVHVAPIRVTVLVDF